MIRFLLLISLLTGIIVSSTYAGVARGMFQAPTFLWVIEAFLLGSSLVIFYVLFRRAGTPAFNQSYLFSVVAKIGGFATFMLIIIFLDGDGAPGNVVLFMVTYALFTALEVGLLFKKINR